MQETVENETKDSTLGVWLFLVGTGALLVMSRTIHYLLFHTLAELFAITVSFSIFALTWTSQKYLKNSYLIVLGAAYGTIGVIDVFHTLTFQGMNLFPGVTTNHPTQFWLTARALEAGALVVAALYVRRPARFSAASWVSALFGTLACLAVWYDVLPATYIDEVGLTPFKIASEYAIVGLLLVALALLWRIRAQFPVDVFRLVCGSLLLTIATEICFVNYVEFYDFINELGHYFRLSSVVLAFLAIVVTGIRRPTELLFRQLLEKERELTVVNKRLEKSENRLKDAQTVAGVGSWHLDIPTGRLSLSNEAYRILGLASGTAMTLDRFIACVHPDDRGHILSAWKAALAGALYDVEHRIIVGEQTRWVRTRTKVDFDEDGRALTGVGSVQDISDRKHAEDAIRRSEARLKRAELASQAGNWEIHLDDMTVIASEGAYKVYGIEQGNIDLPLIRSIPLPEYRAMLDKALAGLIERKEAYDVEFQIRTVNSGEIRDVHSMADFDRESRTVFGVIQDITERKKIERKLEVLAQTDTLTGLANRRQFMTVAEQALSRALRYGGPLSMLIMDIDHFKAINDTYGHQTGDLVLGKLGALFIETSRGVDFFGRIGGEEFAGVLPETDLVQALEVAERLRHLVEHSEFPAREGPPLRITLSVGLTTLRDRSTRIGDLLREADLALYRAKSAGRNQVCVFDEKAQSN